ncbi:phage baseplate assembly protein V [Dongia sp.]|uniref:phage baseplate assembly protein V n=1 Tax=Dongia sp. TaxID=1977262 RepID=UPI0037527815
MNMMDPMPRETTIEAGGYAKGVAVAVVRDNKDASGQARVKVSYPWYEQPRQSYWARVAMPMAGGKRGVYFVPEVNDEVLVAFDRGDLRFPYVIGCLWNGVDKAPETNGDGKNDKRLIHTRKGHKLIFDDGAKGLVQLQLNDGKMLKIDDEGIAIDDAKGNSMVILSNSGGITITAKAKLALKAAQISIESSGTMDIKAGATLGLRGAMVNIN